MDVLCAIMCGGANVHPDAARAFADGICSARVHQPLLQLIAAQPHTSTAVKVGTLCSDARLLHALSCIGVPATCIVAGSAEAGGVAGPFGEWQILVM